MDRSSSATSSVLPGKPVLALCALILFAGYTAAILRPGQESALTAATPSADPGNETVEP